MSIERDHDPSVEDVAAARGPKGDADADDDMVGQVQSAEWRTSSYRSSRKMTDLSGGAVKVPRKGGSDRSSTDPEDDTEGQSRFRPPVD